MCCARSSKKYPKNTGGSNGSLQSVPVVDIVSVYLSIYLSICLSLSLSIHPYIHPSIDLSIYAKKKKRIPSPPKRNLGFVGHPPSRGTFPAASSSAAARRASIRIQCGRRFQIEKWDVVKSIINGIVLGLFTSINSML